MKLTFGSHTVETSNDDKRLFPKSGFTKADVIRYYADVAELMRPHLRDRCLTLQRFPDGIGEGGFFQQHRSDHFPDYVGSRQLETAAGGERIDHIVAENTAALAYLANQGAITFHGWLSRANAPQTPDRLVFDLDPGGDGFDTVVDCARHLRGALEACGLAPYVMTTGSRGLHVIAPLRGDAGFEALREFAANVASAVAAREPSRFATEQRKKARRGRLYIDIARNAYGQTAVLPYSLRAIEGAPVATPLDWDELGRGDLSPRKYTLENLSLRLGQKDDPFGDFARHARKPDLRPDTLAAWRDAD